MNVADIIILIALALGALAGFKAGVIKKTADFLGTFIIVILAFFLKNDLSVLMYENLPFFDFGGFIKGIDVINILVYELLAFIIVAAALTFILKVFIMITGLIEKLLKMTVFLSIPSKILGIFVGALEHFVYVFLVLVFLNLPAFNIPIIKESNFANKILNNTPILSSLVGTTVDTYTEVYNVLHNNKTMSEVEINEKILDLYLEKEVITVDSAQKLIDMNKIYIENTAILDKYR